jgi:ribose 5-phosphate isomerase B
MTRKIHIGADHAGFELKQELIKFLEQQNYEVVDHGAFEYEEDDDYPDFIFPVAKSVVLDGEVDAMGIVIGGSGQGEAIAANRIANVRAVVFNGQYDPVDGREVPQEVVTARQHNDANVLSLGARFITEEEAKEVVETFLDTAFSGDERHIRRIQKIEQVGI